MRVTFDDFGGVYAIGECGIVDLESYEELESAVENRDYGNFDKKELFWTIYDQIILPIREAEGVDPDHSIRLLYIEDQADNLVLHYYIDDYDETYCEIKLTNNMTLEDVMKVISDDFCLIKNSLPDGTPLKDAISWHRDRKVNVPDDYIERLKRDVFYTSWVIKNI